MYSQEAFINQIQLQAWQGKREIQQLNNNSEMHKTWVLKLKKTQCPNANKTLQEMAINLNGIKLSK